MYFLYIFIYASNHTILEDPYIFLNINFTYHLGYTFALVKYVKRLENPFIMCFQQGSKVFVWRKSHARCDFVPLPFFGDLFITTCIRNILTITISEWRSEIILSYSKDKSNWKLSLPLMCYLLKLRIWTLTQRDLQQNFINNSCTSTPLVHIFLSKTPLHETNFLLNWYIVKHTMSCMLILPLSSHVHTQSLLSSFIFGCSYK